jgi:hypothetical protein
MAADTKIIERIHKLLALATSDNENEAAIAASKAQTMLMEYNISEEELNKFSNKEAEKVIETYMDGKNKYNRVAWQNILATAVARANLCRLLTSGTGQIWIGKPTNIEVAHYIYENLVRDLMRICDLTWDLVNERQMFEPKWSRVHGKTWKNNFYHGANQSISERLTTNLRQLKEAQPPINALVVNNDVEIKEYLNIRYPHLSSTSYTLNRNTSGFEAGKSAGRSVSFRSGIGAGGSSGPKLLKG